MNHIIKHLLKKVKIFYRNNCNITANMNITHESRSNLNKNESKLKEVKDSKTSTKIEKSKDKGMFRLINF